MRPSIVLLPLLLSAAVLGQEFEPKFAANCPDRALVVTILNECGYDISVLDPLGPQSAGDENATIVPGGNYRVSPAPVITTQQGKFVQPRDVSVKRSKEKNDPTDSSFYFEYLTSTVPALVDNSGPAPPPTAGDAPPDPAAERLTHLIARNYRGSPFPGSTVTFNSTNTATGAVDTVVWENGVPTFRNMFVYFACSPGFTVTLCSA